MSEYKGKPSGNSWPQFSVNHSHPSLIQNQDDLAIKGSTPSQRTCGLCDSKWEETHPIRHVIEHLTTEHWEKRVAYGDHFVVPCYNVCRDSDGVQHYHCPGCGQVFGQQKFESHAASCGQSDTIRKPASTKVPLHRLINMRICKLPGWQVTEEEETEALVEEKMPVEENIITKMETDESQVNSTEHLEDLNVVVASADSADGLAETSVGSMITCETVPVEVVNAGTDAVAAGGEVLSVSTAGDITAMEPGSIVEVLVEDVNLEGQNVVNIVVTEEADIEAIQGLLAIEQPPLAVPNGNPQMPIDEPKEIVMYSDATLVESSDNASISSQVVTDVTTQVLTCQDQLTIIKPQETELMDSVEQQEFVSNESEGALKVENPCEEDKVVDSQCTEYITSPDSDPQVVPMASTDTTTVDVQMGKPQCSVEERSPVSPGNSDEQIPAAETSSVDSKASIDNVEDSQNKNEVEKNAYLQNEELVRKSAEKMKEVKAIAGSNYHVTLVHSLFDVPLPQCDEVCCSGVTRWHCQLCPKYYPSPMSWQKIHAHLSSQHWKPGVTYKNFRVLACRLGCLYGIRDRSMLYPLSSHWHCPLCPRLLPRRTRLIKHLRDHQIGSKHFSQLPRRVWPLPKFIAPPAPVVSRAKRPEAEAEEDEDEDEQEDAEKMDENVAMDEGDEIEDKTTKTAPRAAKVFQVVAAVVLPEMLRSIHGNRGAFLRELEEETGVLSSQSANDYCMLQGDWCQLSQAHDILNHLRMASGSEEADIQQILSSLRRETADASVNTEPVSDEENYSKQSMPQHGRPQNHDIQDAASEPPAKRPRGRPRLEPIKESSNKTDSPMATTPGSDRVKKGRGRPRIYPVKGGASSSSQVKSPVHSGEKRGRGRPRIHPVKDSPQVLTPSPAGEKKRGRGRPRIYPVKEELTSGNDSDTGVQVIAEMAKRRRGRQFYPVKEEAKSPERSKQKGTDVTLEGNHGNIPHGNLTTSTAAIESSPVESGALMSSEPAVIEISPQLDSDTPVLDINPVRKSSRQRPPHLFLDRDMLGKNKKSSSRVMPDGEARNVDSARQPPGILETKQEACAAVSDNIRDTLIACEVSMEDRCGISRKSNTTAEGRNSDQNMQPVVVIQPLCLKDTKPSIITGSDKPKLKHQSGSSGIKGKTSQNAEKRQPKKVSHHRTTKAATAQSTVSSKQAAITSPVTHPTPVESDPSIRFDIEYKEGGCELKIVLPDKTEAVAKDEGLADETVEEEPHQGEEPKQSDEDADEEDVVMAKFTQDSTSVEDTSVVIDTTLVADDIPIKQEVSDAAVDPVVVLKSAPKALPATQCTVCYRPFHNRKHFLLHLMRTSCGNVENYKQLPEGTSEELERAQREIKEPKCPMCGMSFAGIAPARAHFLTAVCQRGPKTTTYPDLNVKGVVFDRNSKQYLCPACDFKGKSYFITAMHFCRLHAEKTIPCDICGRKYSHERLLRDHIRQIHESQPAPNVECDLCGKSIRARYMKNHINTHHNPNYKPQSRRKVYPLYCDVEGCDFQTHYTSELYRHRKRLHEIHQKICEDCGRTFALQADLNRHRRERHLSTTEGKVECPQCKKSMLARNLTSHIRTVHEGERRYTCSICGRNFQTQYVLKCHEDTHKAPADRRMKYLCSYCGRGFRNRTIYADHLNVHTGARPHSCPECSKTFRLKSVLKRHRETHQGGGVSHSCDVCAAVFTTVHNLYQHRRRHCDKTYVCVCKAVFQNFKTLRMHRLQCKSWLMNKDTTATKKPESVAMATVEEAMLFLQGGSLVQENGETMVVVETPDGGTSDEILSLLAAPQMLESGEVQESSGAEQVTILNMDNQEVVLQEETPATTTESLDRFLCGYCQQLFLTFEDVQEHMMQVHVQDASATEDEMTLDVTLSEGQQINT